MCTCAGEDKLRVGGYLLLGDTAVAEASAVPGPASPTGVVYRYERPDGTYVLVVLARQPVSRDRAFAWTQTLFDNIEAAK